MKAEDDPLLRFVGYLPLFFIAIVIDVLRTLCSPIAGGATLVLTIAAFAGWGLQAAMQALGAVLIVIALYHVSIALAALDRYKMHRRKD